MRLIASGFWVALGLTLGAASAGATPTAPSPPDKQAIIQVADDCGRGFHVNRWGRCSPNHYGYNRPYRESYYRPYRHYDGYYGGGYYRGPHNGWGY
jgi:hypothetical protein